MSVAIGASATGARAYTATASQGLLYMAEALYNAAGLGLPIVMTVANRAIGAPINIWNDHRTRCPSGTAAGSSSTRRTTRRPLDLHLQAFRLAEEVSLPVMVCMDGFILTHANERVDTPVAAAGRRVPAALRAAPAARPRRTRSRSARWSARRRSPRSRYLAHARQEHALGADPADRGGVRRAASAGTPAAWSAVPGGRRGDDHRRPRLGARHDRGRRSTRCAPRASRSGRSAIKSFRPFPLDEVRAAVSGAKRVVVLEKAWRSASGGIVSRTCGWPWPGCRATVHGRRRARRPGHHQGLAAATCCAGRCRADSSRLHLPGHGLRSWSQRELAPDREGRPLRAGTRRTCCVISGPSSRIG